MTRKEKKHCKLFIKKHVNVSWQIITRLVSIMRCVVPPFYAPARCGDGRWETKCRHIPCRDPVNGAQLEVDLMYIACLDLKFMYHECLILIAKRVWLEWNVTFRVVDVLALLLELVMIPLGFLWPWILSYFRCKGRLPSCTYHHWISVELSEFDFFTQGIYLFLQNLWKWNYDKTWFPLPPPLRWFPLPPFPTQTNACSCFFAGRTTSEIFLCRR